MPTADWGSTDLGGTIGMLSAPISLRVAHWRAEAQGAGTVILVQGRAEFIEVYAETIADLRENGFSVVAFDFRGQGGSARTARGNGGHVGNFAHYGQDLCAVVRHAHELGLPRPFTLLAHSMGGLVALRFAQELAGDVDRMVLLAPLLEVANFPLPVPLARAIGTVAATIGLSSIEVGGGEVNGRPFETQRITSDPARFALVGELVKDNPSLSVGPPTVGWVNAALRAMGKVGRAAGKPLPIPTLVIASAADEVVSTAAIEAFAHKTAGVGLVTLYGAKHQILLERDTMRDPAIAAIISFAKGAAGDPLPPVQYAGRPLRFAPADGSPSPVTRAGRRRRGRGAVEELSTARPAPPLNTDEAKAAAEEAKRKGPDLAAVLARRRHKGRKAAGDQDGAADTRHEGAGGPGGGDAAQAGSDGPAPPQSVDPAAARPRASVQERLKRRGGGQPAPGGDGSRAPAEVDALEPADPAAAVPEKGTETPVETDPAGSAAAPAEGAEGAPETPQHPPEGRQKRPRRRQGFGTRRR